MTASGEADASHSKASRAAIFRDPAMVHDFQPSGQHNSAALSLQCPDSVGARLVGLAYVCALLGNVWAVINPWDNLFRAALIYSVIQRAR